MLSVLAAIPPQPTPAPSSSASCVAGEPRSITAVCAHEPRVAAHCPICRSFTNLRAHRRTSTTQVIAQRLTPAEYLGAHHDSLLRAGLCDTATVRALAGASARDAVRAAALPVGALLCRVGDRVEQQPPRPPDCDHGPFTPDDPPRDPAVSLGTGSGVLNGLSEVAP